MSSGHEGNTERNTEFSGKNQAVLQRNEKKNSVMLLHIWL